MAILNIWHEQPCVIHGSGSSVSALARLCINVAFLFCIFHFYCYFYSCAVFCA
ncbi:hypothetical protein BDV41DRAFT_520056 [Aspergillus transmontanensis]|uniref:Uncharacterized protein n=1 Tax=Aspergillus transmontanensis TaxID=1034304 RepID=A0A5N6WF24_9EURO|nr:hypothetical protein BDV41DRAFT_520056 [Aspergillus transmontanensis]